MDRNFYFDVEATMVAGSAAFAAGISANRVALGLTVAQCDAYAVVDAELQSAHLVTSTPSTRTSVAIERKNAAIKAMQRAAVNVSSRIRANPDVNNAQLIALGLLPRTRRRRRHAPDKAPTLNVLSVRGRVVTIRVFDPDSASRRRKAFGACAAQIFSYVGEQPPADPHAYHFDGMTSRTKTQVTFANHVPSGATAWLSVRWMTARGETSVASAPLRVTIQGGSIVPETKPLALAA